MVRGGAIPRAERLVLSRLHHILHHREVLVGSLVRMKRRCGGAGCRCQRGHLHASWYLSLRVGGQPRMVYVPAAWEGRVRTWIARGQALRDGVKRLSALTLQRLERRDEG